MAKTYELAFMSRDELLGLATRLLEETWQPMQYGDYVEDTRYLSAVSIDIDDDNKTLLIGDEEGVRALVPPDDVRLCRRIRPATAQETA